MTPDEEELARFIGVGGKTPEQIADRYGTSDPPALQSLLAQGIVRRRLIVLPETSATGRDSPDQRVVYELTDDGISALPSL
jgi:hypothetical protein